MSRSPALGADDPRHRSGADRELDWVQRFNQDQFDLDDDDKITLRIKPNPVTATVSLPYVLAETGGPQAVWKRQGIVGGPELDNTSRRLKYYWILPGDLDRSRPATAELRWAEKTAASGTSYDVQLDAFTYTKGVDLIAAISATATANFTGTTANNDGFENGGELALEPGRFFESDMDMVWFAVKFVDAPTTTTFVVHSLSITYTPRYYHTHEG